jgi:flavin reductase (DIM6/NTAB) family NADH-FMN oxidoreductase RutF
VIDADTYRSVLGRFASGVTIVTARNAAGEDHGMTVSAFCSVSLSPPMVLVCVDHSAELHALLAPGEHFGVSILSQAMEAHSRRFADARMDRFDGIGYVRGECGVVLIEDALAHLECRVAQQYPAGDHTIFVADVVRARALQGEPLLYYRGGYSLPHP